MDKYSVKNTHDALKNKLIDYINTEYLGKNDALRRACSEELQKSGMLYQEPFIEANPAYITIPQLTGDCYAAFGTGLIRWCAWMTEDLMYAGGPGGFPGSEKASGEPMSGVCMDA